MFVLGVDPGVSRCGYGCVSSDGGRLRPVAVGVLSDQPGLRARLDETEERLAALRRSMLETYGAWGRAMDDLENLWAVVGYRRELSPMAA